MTATIVGSGGNLSVNETLFKPLRVTLKPNDIGSLGTYIVGGTTGTISGVIISGNPIFSMQYTGGSGKYALIRRIWAQAFMGASPATNAQMFLALYALRSYTVADSGGNSLLSSVNQMATSQAASGMGAIQIANTGALTPGTRTQDNSPMGLLAGVSTTTPYVSMQGGQPQPLFDRSGDQMYPLILGNNEGLCVVARTLATGNWLASVQVEWEEVSSVGSALAA